MNNNLNNKEFPGEVVDINDPQKKGRVKVKVSSVYDKLETEDIPWAMPLKTPNGKSFTRPELGQVVDVRFEKGDHYRPIYSYAEHYNINLQKKLDELSEAEYDKFSAIHFDDIVQIYKDDSKLLLDYAFNQLILDESSINLALKDNMTKIKLGTESADQQAVLGNNFFDWMDDLIQVLFKPYLGNSGAPVVPDPTLIQVLNKYYVLRNTKFLSDNIDLVDNGMVDKIDRIAVGQIGDKWKSTIKENEITVNYIVDTPKDTNPEIPVEGDTTPDESLQDPDIITQEPSDPVGGDSPTEILAILKAMEDKNYKIETDPYKMNIVGIRNQYNGQQYSNKFTDRMYLIFKDTKGGKWKYKSFPCSTMPGAKIKVKSKHVKQGAPKEWLGSYRPMKSVFKYTRKKGLGIMAEGQIQNVYKMSTHLGLRAMKIRTNQFAYRDQNWDSKNITYTYRDTGSWAAMYIHKAFNGNSVSKYVNNWSEGCQVFPSLKVLTAFFDLCEKHKNMYDNKFHYTLMTSRDVNTAREKLEA